MKTFLPLSAALLVAAQLPLVSGAAPRPRPFNPAPRINEVVTPLDKAKKPYADLRAALEALRAEPDFATNAAARAAVDLRLVGLCRTPGWTALKRWNHHDRALIPGYALRSVDDPEVPFRQRVELAEKVAEYYAGEEKFDEAEQILRRLLADPAPRSPAADMPVHVALVDVFRWQDRFEDAWTEVGLMADVDAAAAAKKAAALVQATGSGHDRMEELWAKADPFAEIMFYSDPRNHLPGPRDVEGLAQAYVANPSNPPARRVSVVAERYMGNAPESYAARKALAGIDIASAKFDWRFGKSIDSAFQHADWALVEDLFRVFGENAYLAKSPRFQRIRLLSLAAGGHGAEAAVLARECAANTNFPALDRAKFRITEALASGRDLSAALDAAGLDHKGQVALTLTAARQALLLGRNDFAEALADRYEKFFASYPQREQKVVFSAEPITSINDWRRIYPKLEKQYCDRPWGLKVDLLETDVATGREIVEATERDSKNARMELTSVCDVAGLHLFLRVEDPNARAVESGFAGGIGTEMYFAPGLYEPYVCFGSSPRGGVGFSFQTAYESLHSRRIDMMGQERPGEFRSEVGFSDDDYVLHLFFPWDVFYDKLPSKDRPWRFECIAYTPSGNFSWGGSEGIHNSSRWGNLVFDLKPEEQTAIRRRLLYRTVKGGWRKDGRLDRFDKWADEAIGDPAFYAEALQPLQEELDGYAKRIVPEMTDEQVNEVFDSALARMKGLKHEIDALRRNWLQRSLTE